MGFRIFFIFSSVHAPLDRAGTLSWQSASNRGPVRSVYSLAKLSGALRWYRPPPPTDNLAQFRTTLLQRVGIRMGWGM